MGLRGGGSTGLRRFNQAHRDFNLARFDSARVGNWAAEFLENTHGLFAFSTRNCSVLSAPVGGLSLDGGGKPIRDLSRKTGAGTRG